MINYKGLGWINQDWVGGGGDTKLIKCAVGYILVEIFVLSEGRRPKKRRPPIWNSGGGLFFFI